MTPWILLAVSAVLVGLSGVFVAAEFSLVTVDRSGVERAASEGDSGARAVLTALRALSTQLSGAQVGITLTNLAIGFLAEPAIATLVRPVLSRCGVPSAAVHPTAITVALVLSTLATMIFGELLPKNLAIAAPLATAKATVQPQRVFTSAMRWPIAVLNGSANLLVRRLGVEPQEELRSARTSAELASLIHHSAHEGTLDEDTADLMERSVEFGTRTAGEIMTPRVRVRWLQASAPVADVVALARKSGHSRFPVVGADEEVVGTVHVKHAVTVPVAERSTATIAEVMAAPILVPDSLRLDPLLELLRRDGFQMAVVLDEYGGHAGIVTLEDVVEEIVGDIADEHDRIGARGHRRLDSSWSVSGLLRPDEVEDLTAVGLPEHDEYDTVAGLVLRSLGRVPTVGDHVDVLLPAHLDQHGEELPRRVARLLVERMDGNRIDRLALTTREASAEDLHE